ncbi:hypothetical protein PMAYCL1PPCAC_02011, partial [Pristionchus mayeri]
IIQIEAALLVPSSALRSIKEHFASVREWMDEFTSPDHLLFHVIDDGSGILHIVDGKARKAAVVSKFGPLSEVHCSIYPGTISEYCCTLAHGVGSCSHLTVEEKVEMVVRLKRVLCIRTADPSTLSDLLREICEHEDFPIRICRLAVITNSFYRRALGSAFGDDKKINEKLFRALLSSFRISKRKTVDACLTITDREELMQELTGKECVLTRTLRQKGYSDAEAEEICAGLDDVPVKCASNLINSGPSRSTRIRLDDKDATLPTPTDLIQNIKAFFRFEKREAFKRFGAVAEDELSGDLIILPGTLADYDATMESIEEIVKDSTDSMLFLLPREKRETPLTALDSVPFTLRTSEEREDPKGIRLQSIDGLLLRAENGRVLDEDELIDWMNTVGLVMDMSSADMKRVMGGPFSIGVSSLSIPSHRDLFIDLLPHCKSVVINRPDATQLKEVLTDNYESIPLAIRKPPPTKKAATKRKAAGGS